MTALSISIAGSNENDTDEAKGLMIDSMIEKWLQTSYAGEYGLWSVGWSIYPRIDFFLLNQRWTTEPNVLDLELNITFGKV